MSRTQVRAAGGVVVRDGCVLLVHRPATTTGRSRRASSTRASPGRRRRAARSRRRPGFAASSARRSAGRTTSTRAAARRRCGTTGWSRRRAVRPERGRRGALGAARRGARAPQLPPRSSSCSAVCRSVADSSFPARPRRRRGADGRRDRPGRGRLGPAGLAARPVPRRDRAGARARSSTASTRLAAKGGPDPGQVLARIAVGRGARAGRPDDRGGRRGCRRQGGRLPPRRRGAAGSARSSPRTRARSRSPRSPPPPSRPDRVIGMHFFNPVPVLKLVEVIRAERTSDETRRGDRRARARARQGAGRGARRRRVRLEPDPDAVHQRGRLGARRRASPAPRRSTPLRSSASAIRSARSRSPT